MVELQFSKAKDVKEKKLSYGRWVELVAGFAAIKALGVDPLVVGAYTGPSPLDPS